MAYFGSVTITNKFGWSKTVDMKKALILVGKNKSNDIVLSEDQGAGVSAIHLQLLSPKTSESVYRIVNLADNPLEIISGPSAGTLLKSRSAHVIHDGDVLVLGEFTLAFTLLSERGISIERRTTNLGMKLELPNLHLRDGKKLAGLLTLTNYGDTRRCQFTIEVEGLPNECFQVSPAPLLYPSASGEVEIRFIHLGNRPAAGCQTVTISASASQAYPLEMIQISTDLMVEPVYKYSLAFDKEKPVPVEITSPEFQAQAIPAIIPDIPEAAFVPDQTVEISSPYVQFQQESPPVFTKQITPLPIAHQNEMSVQVPDATSRAAEERPQTTVSKTEPSTQPFQTLEPVKESEAIDENEQNWWTSQQTLKSPQRQTDTLIGSRKNLRSMLASNDIQVIKAGKEEIEDETSSDDISSTITQQNGSAE